MLSTWVAKVPIKTIEPIARLHPVYITNLFTTDFYGDERISGINLFRIFFWYSSKDHKHNTQT